jgi:hypothetical protein
MLVPPDRSRTASGKVFWFFSSEKNTFFPGLLPAAVHQRQSHLILGHIIAPHAMWMALKVPIARPESKWFQYFIGW